MAYTLTGEKCGTVRFEASRNGTINGETFTHSSKVTQNPIEGGANINDHVFRNPAGLQIKGTVIGGQNAHDRRMAMWKKGDIITYEGRVRIGNLVITNISENFGPENRNGFNFTATFQVVSFGSAEYSAFGTVPMMSQQDSGKAAPGMNTSATRSDGLKTTSSTSISIVTTTSRPAAVVRPHDRHQAIPGLDRRMYAAHRSITGSRVY